MPGDNFNRFAHLYDFFIHPRKKIVWKQNLLPDKKKYLFDLGGGTGRLVPHLLTMAEKVVLVDHSFLMLKVSKHGMEEKVERVCCDLQHLPFTQNLQANFVMIDTVHHLYNPQEVIESLLPIIHGKNVLLIEEPDIEYFMIKLIAVVERLLRMDSHFFRKNEIINWINRSNYSIDNIQDGANFIVIIKSKNYPED